MKSGFLCVDKPRGVSSFGVVARVRRTFGCSKAGHAGTLDPAASGLLLVALGDATRLLPYLQLEPKKYRFGVQFGRMTDTLDTQGSLVKTDGPIPSRAAVERVLPGFIGLISQVPPEFSAIKVGGKRAYRLARQGKSVELAARSITVFALTLLDHDEATGQALFDTTCSGGTYVRALARDIAAACGTFGYALSVRRLAIGGFSVERACLMSDLESASGAIITVKEALQDRPVITLDDLRIARIKNGRSFDLPVGIGVEDGETAFAFDSGQNLAAVLKRKPDGMLWPEKVFIKEEKRKSVAGSQKPE
jgi:tRNA pseudouridine55 synthase